MGAAQTSWLSTVNNASIDLEQEQSDATDFEQLRSALASKPLPDGTDSPIALLQKLNSTTAPNTSSLNQALLTRLQNWYQGAIASNANLEPLRKLQSSLSDICKDSKDQTTAISWPLDMQTSGVAGPVHLTASAHGNFLAKLIPCATPPERAGTPPADTALIQVTVEGEFQVEAATGLPLSRFQIDVGASAAGAFSCSYYSSHPANMRLAPALAAVFGRLNTSPDDLAGIASRVCHREFHCVALVGRGSISFSGQIALASPLSLLGGAMQVAQCSYGYSALLDGDFDYLIKADQARPDTVVLHLTRRRAATTTGKASLQVGLDLTSTYTRIKDQLHPYIGALNTALGDATDWLEPGTRIGDAIKREIASIPANQKPALEPVLNAIFGFSTGNDAIDALSQLTGRQVAATLSDLQGQAATSAASIANWLVARAVLPPALRAPATTALTDALTKAIKSLQTTSAAAINQAAKSATAGQVAAALTEAGIAVQSGLQNVSNRVAAIRDLVTRYRTLAAKLQTALQSTTEVKVRAQLTDTDVRSDTHSADLTIRFDPTRQDAQRTYRLAILGHFEAAIEAAKDPASGVEILDCALTRVLRHSDTAGLAVSVLGFNMESKQLLTTDTRITTDAAGNLSIESRGAFEQRRQLFDESKTIRFVDVFSLAAAHATGSLALAVTLSYEDKKLNAEEVAGFFESLVRARLLTSASRAKALQFLRETHQSTPTCGAEGRLDVGLTIDGSALNQMLGIGSPSPADEVRRVASQELAAAYIASLGTREEELAKALQRSFPSLAGGVAGAVLSGLPMPTGGLTDDSPNWNHYLAINQLHAICTALADALGAMRAIYLTDPKVVATWDPTIWHAKQEAITLKFASNVPGDFPSLFGAERVRPRTLALFRILARLAGLLTPTEHDVLTASMTLCGADAARVVIIA